MRTRKQKKVLMMCCLLGIAAVLVLVGFLVVASPAKITFDSTGGTKMASIKGAPTGSLNLPVPVRQGWRFRIAGRPRFYQRVSGR